MFDQTKKNELLSIIEDRDQLYRAIALLDSLVFSIKNQQNLEWQFNESLLPLLKCIIPDIDTMVVDFNHKLLKENSVNIKILFLNQLEQQDIDTIKNVYEFLNDLNSL